MPVLFNILRKCEDERHRCLDDTRNFLAGCDFWGETGTTASAPEVDAASGFMGAKGSTAGWSVMIRSPSGSITSTVTVDP